MLAAAVLLVSVMVGWVGVSWFYGVGVAEQGDAEVVLEEAFVEPERWSVRVVIYLSDESKVRLVGEDERAEDDVMNARKMAFEVHGDGRVLADQTHPWVRRDWGRDAVTWAEWTSYPIGFMPAVDQRMVLIAGREAVSDYRAAEEAGEIEGAAADQVAMIDLILREDGDTGWAVHRVNADRLGELGLMQDVFTGLRRSLPVEFDRLFDLLRVEEPAWLDAAVAGEYERCPLHGEWMVPGDTKITYGTISLRPPVDNGIDYHLYPQANLSRWGGGMSGRQKLARTLYCDTCREGLLAACDAIRNN